MDGRNPPLLDRRFRAVEIDDPNDHLLSDFYYQLLMPSFGLHPNGFEPFETFQEMLGAEHPYRLHAVVVVDESDTVMGGITFEYYPRSKCTVAAYMTIRKALQAGGLGTYLFSQMLTLTQKHHPDNLAIFGETDPDGVERSKDVMNPGLRRRILAKLGFQFLDVNYVAAPISESGGKYDYSLMVYNRDPSVCSIPAKTVLDWLEEYYEVYLGEHYLEDEDARSILQRYSATDRIEFVSGAIASD